MAVIWIWLFGESNSVNEAIEWREGLYGIGLRNLEELKFESTTAPHLSGNTLRVYDLGKDYVMHSDLYISRNNDVIIISFTSPNGDGEQGYQELTASMSPTCTSSEGHYLRIVKLPHKY